MNITSLKNNKLLINILIILSFIFLSLISVILLLKNHSLYIGWDTQFHFKRIMELKESFMHFNYLPNFSFNEFHGSSVMSLYPYLNLFPVILLSFVIKSKINLIYIFFIFNIILSFIISFYSSKNYIKSYSISYVFSIIYSLSGTFFSYHFLMNDFGIVSSYIFLPLVIFSFVQIINSKNNWIELSIGMSLIFLGHIINLILITFFLMIFLLINVKKLNLSIIVNLLKSISLFIIITSIIWLPFLHVYLSNFNNIHIPESNQLNYINIKEFLSGLLGSKTINSIGFFPLISLFITPFMYKKLNIYMKQFYILSLIIIICSLFLPLKIITTFGIFKLLNTFQFTWRFLFIPQMLLSFIFALIINQYIYSNNKRIIIYLFIIIISVFMQLIISQYRTINNLSNNKSINFYLQNKIIDISDKVGFYIKNSSQFNLLIHNTYNMEDNDYIPKSALYVSSYVNHNLGFYNNYRKIKIYPIRYNTFKFYKKNNINKISLPIYAYNKEKLHVYLNNKPVKSYTNKSGLITIDHIHNNIELNNNVYIKPSLDYFRIIGAILSIFGYLFILVIIIKRKLNY